MVRKLKFGIAGCGNIAGMHAEAVIHSDESELVAAHSRNKKNLHPFCEKFEIQGYTEYSEFLGHSGLDGVIICTPSGTHLDYGKKAALAGKHVIVEKPIEISVQRGEELLKACDENKVKLAVIYQNRYIKDVLRMKTVIEGGEIGKIFMANAFVPWFRDQEYYSGSKWRGTLDLDGGGAVINQSIHTLDLLQWMAGDLSKIAAFKGTYTHEGIQAEDNAVASILFENNSIGVFTASTSIVPAQKRSVEIFGERGTALLKGDIFTLKTGKGSSGDRESGEAVGADDPLAGMSFQDHMRQYEEILQAINNDEDPPVSGREALKSLAVVEALYKSANESRAVEIREILK